MKLKRKTFSSAGTKALANFNRKVLRRPMMQAKRSAISTKNKIRNAVIGGESKLLEASLNPGKVTSEIIEVSAKNPLTATAALTPVPAILVAPMESGIKKKIPIYKKVTEGLGELYKKSKADKYVEAGINSIVNSSRAFSIPEGHYTGVKDMNKIPSTMDVFKKTVIGGTGVGATLGLVSEQESLTGGAVKGAKVGLVSGIVAKNVINKLHSPMTRVKYQQIDRLIRKEFVKFKSSYTTRDLKDSRNKKLKVTDVFGFNDPKVLDYHFNVLVRDNQVTMYTLGLDSSRLDIASNVLDSYCKKYFGMKYSSSMIDSRANIYSVIIVFTNYNVICDFLLELSRTLNTRINLINSKSDIDNYIGRTSIEFGPVRYEERNYSRTLDKYDLIKILSKGGLMSLSTTHKKKFPSSKKNLISNFILGSILETMLTLGKSELVNLGGRLPRTDFGNDYLKDTLRELRYVPTFNYTIGNLDSTLNISMVHGRFLMTIPKENKKVKDIDDVVWSKLKNLIVRTVVDGVIVYSYSISSRKEFEMILKKLMSLDLKPNIFEK